MMGYSIKSAAILFAALSIFYGCNILDSGGNTMPEPVSLTYEHWVTGGFAGSFQHMVVDSTGLAKMTYTNSPSSPTITYIYRLRAGQLDSLRNSFEASGFFSLDSSYNGPVKILDGFNLSVAWHTVERSKEIRINNYASVPSGLDSLLGFLGSLSEEIRVHGQKF